MLAKTLFAATAALTLGFSSGAFAQTMGEPAPYGMGPAPVYGDGPAVMEEPMEGPMAAPEYGYAPRGYYTEPGYNTGSSMNWRGKIRDDMRNQTNGVNSD